MVLRRPILKCNSYRAVSLGTGYFLTQNKNREKEEIKVKHSEEMKTKKFQAEPRESFHQCKICKNKFKSINNLKKHETKLQRQKKKCTLCKNF